MIKEIENQYQNTPSVGNDRESKIKPRKYTVNPVRYKEHFAQLWEALHQDVIYDIDLTAIDYISAISRAIVNDFTITDEYIQTQDAEMGNDLQMKQQLTASNRKVTSTMAMAEFINNLQEKTMLSRNALIDILKAIPADKYQRIQHNPHQGLELLIKKINYTIFDNIIDCVQIKKSKANTHRQARVSNFVDQHLVATHYLELASLPKYERNGLYNNDIMPFDSFVPEKEVSEQAASDKTIVVYAKLPKGINIPTPIHKEGINPDFGFVVQQKDGQKLYLIAVAKPTTNSEELRKLEDFKVKFLQKYFEGINQPNVRYKTIASYADIQSALGE